MNDSKLAFIGFGNVGQALARLLLRKRQELRERYGQSWRVVAISTRNHGAAINPAGIDLGRALELAQAAASLDELSAQAPPPNGREFIAATSADVLFENTPVDYQTGQPAVDYLKAALGHGMHAITANKGPVVHAYRELTALAERVDRSFRFESAVMDGAPIFSLWRAALPAARLEGFRGVLNSTTNLILSLMEQGKDLADAIAHAQAIGVAESDPRGDIEGWDAAVKVSALVTVLMGVSLKPQAVDRQGIEALSSADIDAARAAGLRWKLICRAQMDGDRVRAAVGPEQVDREDPLYHVMGTTSSITFRSDVLGDLTLTEENPGPDTTAYGLLADFLNAVRDA